MPTISQANRPLEIVTPLGENVLGLRSFVLREQLGRPFVIEAELSSEDPDIKFENIVGHPVAIRLTVAAGNDRYFHAVVARFKMVGQSGQYFHYRATLQPWLWALSRSANCRMYQTMSAIDIVQLVFRDRGFHDFEVGGGIPGSYPVRDYCIQYRESDFNFVSRLLEQEGIAYFFKHDKDKGDLVLADNKAAYSTVKGYEKLSYWPTGAAEKRDDAIKSWLIEHEVQPTDYVLNDYNYLTPKKSLMSDTKIDRSYGLNDRQVYDYPGEYLTTDEGKRLSRVRLEELQTATAVVRAETTCIALSAGSLFTFTDHPRADQNIEHLITSLNLECDAGEFSSAATEHCRYRCEFTAIPSTQAFRPARLTPKPVIHGPQPAVVVGPASEEVYTDEHGRVKVHFYWDRESKADEKSSCWVRVAQGWSGKKWGSIYLPRIGHEVLVEFLEGDPDRPIITGSVYNAENAPPYALPAHATKSALKSSSSKGGGGYNEIRFEDKKGEEQIYIHGEQNQDIRIKNSIYEWVGYDRHLIVKKDQVEHVENNRSEVVDADHMEKIGKDRHLKVVGKEAKAVDGSLSLTVKGDVIEVFKANHSEMTTADYYIKADNIVIEAQTNITLKVGGSSIAIEAGGIGIKTSGQIKVESTGPMDVKATGPLAMESSAKAELKSPATTVKGDGMTTIKGGVVMIN